ncbi:hypothetical protein CORC01_02147 [Colletotrichum orchidophilum]|uniref:Uncharacterized protein n=1 Tax=Colletotrichum orchidophilum TaxID=1209926 RepID=A0A1G4BLW8_9PEZI|nr:uncharacterized protein CORC01_02147 [Colletotrichum orchidophilum]OHF02452.1 hypothetical protein CORC01_02147 [Colletotrichum orchidophilum]
MKTLCAAQVVESRLRTTLVQDTAANCCVFKSCCIRAGNASDGSGARIARQQSPSSTDTRQHQALCRLTDCPTSTAVLEVAWRGHGTAWLPCYAPPVSAAGISDASVWLADCWPGPVAFLLLLCFFVALPSMQ